MLGEGEGGGKKVRGGDVFRVESREKKKEKNRAFLEILKFQILTQLFQYSYSPIFVSLNRDESPLSRIFPTEK